MVCDRIALESCKGRKLSMWKTNGSGDETLKCWRYTRIMQVKKKKKETEKERENVKAQQPGTHP